jgi:hypothetical protein
MTNNNPRIAAALLGLDMEPFIGRPPGRQYGGRCVVDVGDHANVGVVE